jgi:GAG-pre-integrase domain
LTQELNFNINFSSKIIEFQDRETRKIIGEGKQKINLYILKSEEKEYFLIKNKDIGLWHKQLGHPSNRVLNRVFNCFSNTCNTCDICKIAKQAKLLFSLSTSQTHSPFELVHSVWGIGPFNFI